MMDSTNLARNYEYFNGISMVRKALREMIMYKEDYKNKFLDIVEQKFLDQDIHINIMNREDITNQFIIAFPDYTNITNINNLYHIINNAMCNFLNNIIYDIQDTLPISTNGYQVMANVSQSNDVSEMTAFITSLYRIEMTFGGIVLAI